MGGLVAPAFKDKSNVDSALSLKEKELLPTSNGDKRSICIELKQDRDPLLSNRLL